MANTVNPWELTGGNQKSRLGSISVFNSIKDLGVDHIFHKLEPKIVNTIKNLYFLDLLKNKILNSCFRMVPLTGVNQNSVLSSKYNSLNI